MAKQVASTLEKGGNTQQALLKKKQKPDVKKKANLDKTNKENFNHNDFPAILSSNPAYYAGSELTYKQYQASLLQTGDINHPDTQENERDYKSTLSINDLRDYQDSRLGMYTEKNKVKPLYVSQDESNSDISLNKTIQNKGVVHEPVITNSAETFAVAKEQGEKEITGTPQNTNITQPGAIALNTKTQVQANMPEANKVVKSYESKETPQQFEKAEVLEHITAKTLPAIPDKKGIAPQGVQTSTTAQTSGNADSKQVNTKNAPPKEETKNKKEEGEKEIKIVVPETINDVVSPRLDKAVDSEGSEIESDADAVINIIGLVAVAQKFRDQGKEAKEQVEAQKGVAKMLKGKIRDVEKEIYASDSDLQKAETNIQLEDDLVNYLDIRLVTSVNRQQKVEQEAGLYQQEYNKNKGKAADLNTEATDLLRGSQKYQDPAEPDTGKLSKKLKELSSNTNTIAEAITQAGKTTQKLSQEAKQAKDKNEKIKKDSAESKKVLQQSKVKLVTYKQKNTKSKSELAALSPKLKQSDDEGKKLNTAANALLLDSYIIENDVIRIQNAYYANMATVEGKNGLKQKEADNIEQTPPELGKEERLLVAFAQLQSEEEQTAFLKKLDKTELDLLKAKYDEVVANYDTNESDKEALIEQNAEIIRNAQIKGFDDKRKIALQKPLNLTTKNISRITGMKRLWLSLSIGLSDIWTSITLANVGKFFIGMVNPVEWYRAMKGSISGILGDLSSWDNEKESNLGVFLQKAAGIANKLLVIAGVITGVLALLTIGTAVISVFSAGSLAAFAWWLGSATATMGTITFWLGTIALTLNVLSGIKNIYDIHTAKTAEVLFKNSGELKNDIINSGLALLARAGGKASKEGGASLKKLARNSPETFGKEVLIGLKNSIKGSIVSIPRRISYVFKRSTWLKVYQGFTKVYNKVKTWAKERLPEKQPTSKPLSQYGPYEENLGPVSEKIDIDYRLEQLRDAGLNIVMSENTISFFTKSNVLVAEIKEGVLRFKYSGYGGDIVMNPERTTTVLGKFAEIENNPLSNGTRKFLGSNDPYVEGLPDGSFSRGDGVSVGKGGMSFLDIAEDKYKAILDKHIEKYLAEGQSPKMARKLGVIDGKAEFWEKYNYPFLEDAFKRGDDIRLVSDKIEFQGDGTYGLELDAIDGENGLAKKYDYIYKEETKTYIKNGL